MSDMKWQMSEQASGSEEAYDGVEGAKMMRGAPGGRSGSFNGEFVRNWARLLRSLSSAGSGASSDQDVCLFALSFLCRPFVYRFLPFSLISSPVPVLAAYSSVDFLIFQLNCRSVLRLFPRLPLICSSFALLAARLFTDSLACHQSVRQFLALQSNYSPLRPSFLCSSINLLLTSSSIPSPVADLFIDSLVFQSIWLISLAMSSLPAGLISNPMIFQSKHRSFFPHFFVRC
jgi:hypothetical protein